MNRFSWNSGGNEISFDFTGLWTVADGPRWKSEAWIDMLDSAVTSANARFASGSVEFYNWPATYPKTLPQEIRDCAESLRKRYDGLLVLGIGGSYLGPFAVVEALRSLPETENFPIHWVSNVDPSSLAKARRFAETHKSATLVISKSGGTVETMSALFHLAPILDPEGIVAITDPLRGDLRRIAENEGWKTFEVPPAIGGRFSVLTAVGLLAVQCAGLDSEKLLAGALSMRSWLSSSPVDQNAAANLALALWLWDTQHGAKIQYLMPYWANLKSLADWNVQLWGESLGKVTKNTPQLAVGPTPASALGSSDQHSLLQLFREGPRDKVIGFIDATASRYDMPIGTPLFDPGSLSYLCQHPFSKLTTEASLATQKSLSGANVPTYRMQLGELSAETIGAWMFFMETACAYGGELYHVDAYDQPGVEEAKILLKKALSIHTASTK